MDPLYPPPQVEPQYTQNQPGFTPGSQLARYNSIRQGQPTRINEIGGLDYLPGIDSPYYRDWNRTFPYSAATTGSYGSTYRPGYADQPDVKTHEQIHQVQRRLGANQLPNEDELRLMGMRPEFYKNLGISSVTREAPAYELGEEADPWVRSKLNDTIGARKLADYSEALKRKGAPSGVVDALQSAMPESVRRQMLMRYPPGVAWPQPPEGLR